jgi:hypothetical protein
MGGSRNFFAKHDLDWNDFVTNGIPVSTLERIGDPIALRAARQAETEVPAMGGKGGQTIGYHYYFSILFGIGRQVNELRTIMVADKIAWEGTVLRGDVQAIKKPDLFGGEKKEGGIQGPFRIFFRRQGPGAAWCRLGELRPVRVPTRASARCRPSRRPSAG